MKAISSKQFPLVSVHGSILSQFDCEGALHYHYKCHRMTWIIKHSRMSVYFALLSSSSVDISQQSASEGVILYVRIIK